MRNIFNPLTKFFNIDYAERLKRSTENQLYEAKLDFIKVVQQKQYWDNQLKYHVSRVESLNELVTKLKGPEDGKNSSITTITISPT